jgi:alpha-1,2-mannosyltransferase
MKADPDRWLTAKRLRAHALVIGVALWAVYIWTLATPTLRDRSGNLKGTDFLHFYTLGSVAISHDGSELYDLQGQAIRAERNVPDAAGIRYLPLYPPQVSLLFAPLARLSYGGALAVWWTFTCLTYALCCLSIWRACPNLRFHGGLVALIAAASPAFFHLIAWGQTSAIALACFTLMFFLLRERRDFLAGIVLGCLIFKPQLGLAAAIVFAALGSWNLLAGAVLSSATQLAAGVLYYGIGPFGEWLKMMVHARELVPYLEPRLYQTHCLRTFWSMLLPWGGVATAMAVISAGLALAGTIAVWKQARGNSGALPFCALLLATVLVAPHLTVYDLVILAPAILLLADWFLEKPRAPIRQGIGSLLYLVYALPLVGFLAIWTHLQLSVVVMAALLYWIWRAAKSEGKEDLPLQAEQKR